MARQAVTQVELKSNLVSYWCLPTLDIERLQRHVENFREQKRQLSQLQQELEDRILSHQVKCHLTCQQHKMSLHQQLNREAAQLLAIYTDLSIVYGRGNPGVFFCYPYPYP
jgi:hypothetical protein